MSSSLNSPFSFQNKIIIARRLATWEKLVEEGFQTYRKIKLQFWTNCKPNCTLLYPKLERQWRFKIKLNDFWTNLLKIKTKDIIRFLIGQFDFIIGQIKVKLCLRINLSPIEGFN
jgi:hypothetical protein